MGEKEDRFALIVVTLCLVVATLSLIYLEINGVKVPAIVNLPVSIACGAVMSHWFF